MIQHLQTRMTLDAMPRVSQKLKLLCKACGQRHTYDVGRIFFNQEGEGEGTRTHYAFSNYFRCRDCGSAGPWEIADYIKLIGLTVGATLSGNDGRVVAGVCELFDGTTIQAPALGEEHLLRLMDKDPQNAFLCTRLGNLLRGCGEWSRAIEWYEKALALDAGDIEARYHLYSFAVEDCDFSRALIHGPLLVRHLLEGCRSDKEELTRGIALSVADTLFHAPPQFRAEFLGQPKTTTEPPERIFIRTLLEQRGDEDAIVEDAADRLLEGEAEPAESHAEGVEADCEGNDEDDDGPPIDLVPSLREMVEKEGLNRRKLTVALEAVEQGHIRVKDRHSVPVYDGRKIAFWSVPSLRELFRGNQSPPADMDRYPPQYCGYFFFIEEHLLAVCDIQGDRTDQEMESIYSMLRRRPDGKSLGLAHDSLWQVAALLLGRHVLSQLQFEAIMGQLRPVSRNYVQYLRSQALS